MKIKNMIIYLLFCIAILILFRTPEYLLKIEENNIENEVYEKKKIDQKIDIQTEKIYLVKAIHEMESDNSKVEISSSQKSWILVESPSTEENEKNSIPNVSKKQLQKLKEFNILRNFDIDYDSKYNVKLISKTYQGEENYVIDNIFFTTTNELYNIEMEEKTGKILFINFAKEDIYDGISKEEILINYVKYLDLYIIDDWHYENDVLKSDKAGLVVSLLANETRYILSIHSVEKGLNTAIYIYNDVDTN